MQTNFDEIRKLEEELAKLAPLVKGALSTIKPPAAQIDRAVMEAASLAVTQRQSRQRRWQLRVRLVSSVAATLLLGGALYLYFDHHAPTVGKAASADDNLASFASLLLDIQGLSEESFFMSEEGEELWL